MSLCCLPLEQWLKSNFFVLKEPVSYYKIKINSNQHRATRQLFHLCQHTVEMKWKPKAFSDQSSTDALRVSAHWGARPENYVYLQGFFLFAFAPPECTLIWCNVQLHAKIPDIFTVKTLNLMVLSSFTYNFNKAWILPSAHFSLFCSIFRVNCSALRPITVHSHHSKAALVLESTYPAAETRVHKNSSINFESSCFMWCRHTEKSQFFDSKSSKNYEMNSGLKAP